MDFDIAYILIAKFNTKKALKLENLRDFIWNFTWNKIDLENLFISLQKDQ